MSDDDIAAACRRYGAKAVGDAAYAAMNGRRDALIALGLGHVEGLPALYRVTLTAHAAMTDEERAADLMQASIDAAKL